MAIATYIVCENQQMEEGGKRDCCLLPIVYLIQQYTVAGRPAGLSRAQLVYIGLFSERWLCGLRRATLDSVQEVPGTESCHRN